MMQKQKRQWIGFVVMLSLLSLVFSGATAASVQDEADFSLLADYSQWAHDYTSGIPSTSINDVLQTQDGYIWLASYSGLIRFSGDAYVTYTPEDVAAFESLSITTLFEDSKGRMWIGTGDSGALLYEDRVFKKIDCNEEALFVTSFAQLNDGTILMGSKKGLYQIHPNGEVELLDSAVIVDRLMVDSRNQLWMIDAYGAVKKPETFQGVIDSHYNYTSIYEDSRGVLYLGTSHNAVLRFSADKAEVISLGRLSHINDFCEDLNGNVWVCSDSGLGRLDEGGRFLRADGALITSALESIAIDHEGGIWFASSRNGLLQILPSAIRDINFAANLGKRVTNTAILYKDNIYAGTDNGLTIVNKDSYEVLQNELTDSLQNVRIRCLTEDSAGNLWIATYGQGGAIRYDGAGAITLFDERKGLISDKTRQVLALSSGDVAIATNEGISLVSGEEVIASYGTKDGLQNATVLCMTEDTENRIWLGTDGGGIYMLEAGQLHAMPFEGLDSHIILRLLYDKEEEALWIATGASFYCYRNQTLELIEHVGKEVKAVFDIVKTPNGRICLLATEGIYCGTPEELRANSEALALIRIKGSLPYHITANSWNRIDEEGRLFLCAQQELGWFNVASLVNNASLVKLIIDGIFIDGQEVVQNDEIALQADAHRLSIRVSSPHFGFAEKINFEYYLDGFDSAWQHITAGEINEIVYTNLPGGTYTFKVRALNGAGIVSAEKTIIVKKEAHLWERPWVWVVSAFLLGCLTLLLIHIVTAIRTRQILKKQQEYKKITDQAITTISNAIDAKDAYTEGHSKRVSIYAVELGRRMGLDEEELEKLRYIALLHDIGKIGIHDDILNKPSGLNDDEFASMQSHTTIGANILKDFTAVPNIGEGAAAHHEKYDGTGYPKGLKGHEINLTSRIIGVCDTYDAMATTRAYRKALDTDYIVEEILRCSGKQFDPEVAAVMVQMIKDGFVAE